MPFEKEELYIGTFCHLGTESRTIGDINVTGHQQERAGINIHEKLTAYSQAILLSIVMVCIHI